MVAAVTGEVMGMENADMDTLHEMLKAVLEKKEKRS